MRTMLASRVAYDARLGKSLDSPDGELGGHKGRMRKERMEAEDHAANYADALRFYQLGRHAVGNWAIF